MKGSYLPKDKALAEKEFKFCVQALKDREDENVKKWVCNIIASDFGVSVFAVTHLKDIGSNIFICSV